MVLVGFPGQKKISADRKCRQPPKFTAFSQRFMVISIHGANRLVSFQRCASARCPHAVMTRVVRQHENSCENFQSPDRKSPTAYEYLQVPDFAITCTFKVRYLTYPPPRFLGNKLYRCASAARCTAVFYTVAKACAGARWLVT